MQWRAPLLTLLDKAAQASYATPCALEACCATTYLRATNATTDKDALEERAVCGEWQVAATFAQSVSRLVAWSPRWPQLCTSITMSKVRVVHSLMGIGRLENGKVLPQ